MNCQKKLNSIVDSYKAPVLFTVAYNKSNYAVFKTDDDVCECVRLTWNLWSGYGYSDEDVADEIISICNRIISLREMHPEKYRFEGEHYSVSSTIVECDRKMRINKISANIFAGVKHWGPAILRFIFSLLASLLMCHLFANEIISWILYIVPAPALSYDTLKVLVYTLEIISSCILFLVFRERQSPVALYLNAAIPMGLTILLGFMKKWFVVALIAPFAVIIIYKGIGIILSALDMKDKGVCKKKWNLLVLRSALIFLVAGAILSAGILKLAPQNTYTSNSETNQGSVSSEIPEELQAKYRQACWDLYEPTFKEKTWQEKIKILQVICDYECLVNFGCSSAQVCAGTTKDDKTLGYYNNATRTITINIDHLCNGETEDVLDTLLHEVRHHIQHRTVDLYCSLEPHLQDEYRNMSPFKEAALFLDNLNDYHESTEDYDLYYNQTIEKDSRQWASTRLRWYDSFIDGSR